MTDSSNPDAQTSPRKARILLADDSRLVRVTAVRMLADQFDLILAEDGEDAWQKISTDPTIQVVFTDLGMPKLDGYGLIQRVRQSDSEHIRNQPVIVITGASEEEDVRRHVFELGATDFITKPFKATEIIARAEAHATYQHDKDELQRSAEIDVETGALNRQGLTRQLEKDVSFVNRHVENLGVVLFELDDFSSIQQRIGQHGANRILKQTASALREATRKEDSVGRFGPNQFAVILPMAKTEGVVILVKRLCARIKAFKITLDGKAISLSMSAGIATTPKGHAATVDGMLNVAEQALSYARQVGPGQVQLLKHDGPDADENTDPVSIDSLLEAIALGQLNTADVPMSAVVQQLRPLIELMDASQKSRLLQ